MFVTWSSGGLVPPLDFPPVGVVPARGEEVTVFTFVTGTRLGQEQVFGFTFVAGTRGGCSRRGEWTDT